MPAMMMTITEIAGFVGAGLAGVAYVPQISRLRRTRCSAGISQLAFAIWLLASLLTTARAVAIHAGVFIVLGVTQFVATALIMLYATRYKDTPCPSPSASRVQRQHGHRDGHLGRTGKASRWTARLRWASAAPSPITDHRSPTAHITQCRPLRGVKRACRNTAPGTRPLSPRSCSMSTFPRVTTASALTAALLISATPEQDPHVASLNHQQPGLASHARENNATTAGIAARHPAPP
jgi:uncharacterized protein with PQ loop repeat